VNGRLATTVWNPRYFTREGLQEILRSGTAPVPELFLTDNDTRPPKAHQYSGGVRQNLGDFELSASYTGVRGYNSFTWFRANRNVNGTCCAQFPSSTSRRYSNVFVSNDDGRNWYDAMFLSVQKRYTERSTWGWQLSYTLAKAEEDVNAGDVFSALDILTPDRLVRFDKATDGFGTGTNNCTHGNQDCFSGNDWPEGKGRNWYRPDGDAFLGLDMWRTRNIDLRLEKTIRTLRGQNVAITGEVFNVFNYRNFTGFNTNVGNFNNTGGITPNPNFGMPTAALNDLTRMGAQRRAQLGVNYRF